MISKIDPSRYADTGFSIADTPADLNDHLFRKILEKSGAERLKCLEQNVSSSAAEWETPHANSSGPASPKTSQNPNAANFSFLATTATNSKSTEMRYELPDRIAATQ